MAAGSERTRGKSELHRARVPGESRGSAVRRVDSPHWRVFGRESNSNHSRASGLKRAILPAAISDSTVCRLLAKVGSREQSRRRRCDQPIRLREMAITNRTRLTPFPVCEFAYGAFSSFGR